MSENEIERRGTSRRKLERPNEILAAAFEEFVLAGYAATRLEDVAARAGVTKGTVYFHFQSKENVFVQMVQELSKPMRCRTQEFLDCNAKHGIEFFTSYLDFSYAQILDDRYSREIFRLLIAEATRFPGLTDDHFKSVLEPVFSRLQEELARAVNEGKTRNAPALDFPDLLLSPMLMLNIFLLIFADRKAIDPKKHLEAAKDLLLYGLLPRHHGGATA
jgi:AcrR family transcriptional regulator